MLRKSMYVLQDKSHPNVTSQTNLLRQKFEWRIITHTTYSSKFALSAYHLFLELWRHLVNSRFSSDDEVQGSFKDMKGWYDVGLSSVYKEIVEKTHKCHKKWMFFFWISWKNRRSCFWMAKPDVYHIMYHRAHKFQTLFLPFAFLFLEFNDSKRMNFFVDCLFCAINNGG